MTDREILLGVKLKDMEKVALEDATQLVHLANTLEVTAARAAALLESLADQLFEVQQLLPRPMFDIFLDNQKAGMEAHDVSEQLRIRASGMVTSLFTTLHTR